MFKNTLDNKPEFTRPDGIILKDLTQSIFDKQKKTYPKFEVYRVPKEYIMRPDLISLAVYNTTIYTEIILKFNAISNPFTINEGDIILIPDINSAISLVKQPINGKTGVNGADQIRNSYKYIDPLKAPKKNEAIDKFNNRFPLEKTPKENILPPNIATEGTSQITYRDGRVYFGKGAENTNNKDNNINLNKDNLTCLESGITSGKFLTSLINNK